MIVDEVKKVWLWAARSKKCMSLIFCAWYFWTVLIVARTLITKLIREGKLLEKLTLYYGTIKEQGR
jgi:hypothetical protein